LRPISTLTIGDDVLAYNEATGEVDYYPILATIVHQDQVVQLLTIDGETIVTTPNHPFYTIAEEWIPAGQLQVGDLVRRADGRYGMVEAITFVYQPQPMYNLTVDTAHTYFVGDGQWLVHNCRTGYSGPSNGYSNKRPHDLNTALGLQNRKTVEELFSTRDFDRPSDLLGAPSNLRGTNKYIYVIDEAGNIWVSRPGPHHADLVGGANVYGAGEMYIDSSGMIRQINNQSGHYLPDAGGFFSYMESLLKSKGISFDPSVFKPL
jgi:hypothetical protein